MKQHYGRKRIRRIPGWLWIISLFISIAPILPVYAATEETSLQAMQEGTMKLRGENFEILLHYGVEGVARYGRDCLMTGTVTSGFIPGGVVEFTMEDSEGKTQTYAVSLSGKEKGEQFYVVIPMHRYLTKITVAVKNEKRETVTERTIPLQGIMFGPGQAIGIVGKEDQSSYSYLSSFGNYTVMLSPEDFPTREEALSFFDILVIDGEAKLSDAAADTLTQWIRDGGTLVVGTGAQGESTLNSLAQIGIFNGKVGETVELQTCYGVTDSARASVNKKITEYETARDQLVNYIDNFNDAETDGNIGEQFYLGDSISHFYNEKNGVVLYAAETIKLCRFLPTDAQAVVKESGETLLYTQTFGQGQIEWFSFSLDRRNYDYYGVYVTHTIRENQSEKGKLQLQNGQNAYGMNNTNYSEIYSADENKEQQMIPYILVFLLYLILIGPVLYVLLKKKRRSGWIFALLPVVSVCVFAVIYGMGRKTRISKPYVTYVEVVREENNQVNANLYLTAAAPTGEDWKLSFSDGITAKLLPTNIYNYYDMIYLLSADTLPMNRQDHIKVQYNKWNTEVSCSGLSPFSKVDVTVQYDTSIPEVTGDEIGLSPAGVKGTITNTSQISFDESYLVYQGVLVTIGKFLPGECRNLKEEQQTLLLTSSSFNVFYEENDDQQLTSEEQISRQYIYEKFAGSASHIAFIGVTHQLSDNQPLDLSGEDYTVSGGMTMYVSDEIGTQREQEDLFGVLSDDMMQVMEGTYTPGDRYRSATTETIVAEYTLNTDRQLEELSFYPFYNQAYDSYHATGWQGNIYLYNYQTNAFDLLADTYETYVITNPANYKSNRNRIRVKFEKGQMYENQYMELPCLTYVLSESKE